MGSSAALCASIGLALDIAGVVLLFFYGVPSKTGLAPFFVGNEDSLKEFGRARSRSRLGLLLLIVGFLLQIVSNWIPPMVRVDPGTARESAAGRGAEFDGTAAGADAPSPPQPGDPEASR